MLAATPRWRYSSIQRNAPKPDAARSFAAMADPGVGKSLLFHEFKATSQSGWMLLEAVSFLHDKATAYMPVVDLLSRYFDIEAEDVAVQRFQAQAGEDFDATF